jgi:hypothetical protein
MRLRNLGVMVVMRPSTTVPLGPGRIEAAAAVRMQQTGSSKHVVLPLHVLEAQE